jgi:hypothetical protein
MAKMQKVKNFVYVKIMAKMQKVKKKEVVDYKKYNELPWWALLWLVNLKITILALL